MYLCLKPCIYFFLLGNTLEYTADDLNKISLEKRMLLTNNQNNFMHKMLDVSNSFIIEDVVKTDNKKKLEIDN